MIKPDITKYFCYLADTINFTPNPMPFGQESYLSSVAMLPDHMKKTKAKDFHVQNLLDFNPVKYIEKYNK